MKNNSHTLTKGSVGKGILLFALPLLGSSLIQQLYSTVDLIFVGQLLGTKASAAIGASGLIVTCMIGFFNGMAVGTNVFAARHYGARRFEQLKKLIQTIFWTGIIGGFFLTVIGLVLSPVFLTWMGTPESIFPLAVRYLRIYMAMLFIIPGFPFITSGIDLAKLDMRSGIERLGYALIIILVATMSAWIMALILHLQPVDFLKISLPLSDWILFRLLASFCGVFGFSIMFNSPVPLAVTAALIGAIANTLRLELVDLINFPPAAAAFIGALTAGLLASLIKNKAGYPRISVTVPSIVIMVPGLYLYRGFYNLGIMSLATSATWFASAILIILALPLGLIFARILTDKTFRYCT